MNQKINEYKTIHIRSLIDYKMEYEKEFDKKLQKEIFSQSKLNPKEGINTYVTSLINIMNGSYQYESIIDLLKLPPQVSALKTIAYLLNKLIKQNIEIDPSIFPPIFAFYFYETSPDTRGAILDIFIILAKNEKYYKAYPVPDEIIDSLIEAIFNFNMTYMESENLTPEKISTYRSFFLMTLNYVSKILLYDPLRSKKFLDAGLFDCLVHDDIITKPPVLRTFLSIVQKCDPDLFPSIFQRILPLLDCADEYALHLMILIFITIYSRNQQFDFSQAIPKIIENCLIPSNAKLSRSSLEFLSQFQSPIIPLNNLIPYLDFEEDNIFPKLTADIISSFPEFYRSQVSPDFFTFIFQILSTKNYNCALNSARVLLSLLTLGNQEIDSAAASIFATYSGDEQFGVLFFSGLISLFNFYSGNSKMILHLLSCLSNAYEAVESITNLSPPLECLLNKMLQQVQTIFNQYNSLEKDNN